MSVIFADYITTRTVREWNILSREVIQLSTAESFKNAVLSMFWALHCSAAYCSVGTRESRLCCQEPEDVNSLLSSTSAQVVLHSSPAPDQWTNRRFLQDHTTGTCARVFISLKFAQHLRRRRRHGTYVNISKKPETGAPLKSCALISTLPGNAEVSSFMLGFKALLLLCAKQCSNSDGGIVIYCIQYWRNFTHITG